MVYDLFHDTYSSAIQEAIKIANSSNFSICEDSLFTEVTTGLGKPSEGDTRRHSLKMIMPTGKASKKYLQIQVYNRGTERNTYELNCYMA